jgi:16S rRNA (guanine527-N7)-methyltransferase
MAAPEARDVARQARELGFDLGPAAAEPLAAYLGLLERWNRRTNLVGKQGWRSVLTHLAVDSLHLGPFLDTLALPDAPLTLDLGAGAGLPGLPLRCVWRKGHYHLVEPREKRAGFMRSALARMKIPRTSVFQGRAEDVFDSLLTRQPADLILSRAFMPWRELLDFAAPMLSPQGVIVILANEAPPSPAPAGWSPCSELTYSVHGSSRLFLAFTRSANA